MKCHESRSHGRPRVHWHICIMVVLAHAAADGLRHNRHMTPLGLLPFNPQPTRFTLEEAALGCCPDCALPCPDTIAAAGRQVLQGFEAWSSQLLAPTNGAEQRGDAPGGHAADEARAAQVVAEGAGVGAEHQRLLQQVGVLGGQEGLQLGGGGVHGARGCHGHVAKQSTTGLTGRLGHLLALGVL